MLPSSERSKKISQSPYFFKRWKQRRGEIGYVHHQDFISEFYEVFQDPERSFFMPETRTDKIRFADTLCIFQNRFEIFVCVCLKSGEHYEMVNFTVARAWQIDQFNKKEEIRQQNMEGNCVR